MLEVIKRVGSDAVGVNFDISHFNVMGIGIEESVSAMAPHARHTHVKDERGTVPDFEFLIPGEGEFDYVTYLKSMQRHGYTGFITAEISNMVQRRTPYYPLEVATQTYDVLAKGIHRRRYRTGLNRLSKSPTFRVGGCRGKQILRLTPVPLFHQRIRPEAEGSIITLRRKRTRRQLCQMR